MVRIRLARGGVKNDPHYRIVAIHSTRKNSGKALDVLGYWHPKKDTVKIDKKKISLWVEKGAQVSSAVKALL